MTARFIVSIGFFTFSTAFLHAFEPGQKIVSRDYAKLESNGTVVDNIGPGQILTVLSKAEGQVWVSRGRPGWIKNDQVVELQNAEALFQSKFRTGASSREYLARGNVRIAMGNVEDGIQDLRKAVEIASDKYEYLPALAYGLLAGNQQPEAIEKFSLSLKADPKSAAALMGRGLAYFQVGQLANAVGDLNAAIALEPDHAFPRKYLGAVLHDLDRLEEAKAALMSAIKLDGHDGFTRRSYGRLLYDLGELESAFEQFDIAVKLDSNDYEALTGRGVVNHALGKDLTAAARDYERAIEIVEESNDFAHLWSNLGQVQAELGKFEQAIANLNKAVTLDPDFNEARSLRAFYNVTRSNQPAAALKSAMDDLRRVFTNNESRSYWDYRAVAATNAKRGDFKRAVHYQRLAINAIEKFGPARFRNESKHHLATYLKLIQEN